MVEYQGVHGVLEKDGVPFAVAEFTVKPVRGTATQPRSGKWSDLTLPGKIGVSGALKRIMIDGKLLGEVIGTASAGSAEEAHAGLTPPGASDESVTDMTDTSPSSASHVKISALTAAVTGAGYAVLHGTDVNDNRQLEELTIPTLGIDEYVTSEKVFKTLTHVTLFSIVQAGGTLKVEYITGDTTYTVGPATFFTLKGMLVNGSDHIYITMDNCFLTDDEFAFSDADTIANDSVSYTMKDPDADLLIETTG